MSQCLERIAKRIGVPAETIALHLHAGEKWCTWHRAWHQRAEFSSDRTRYDGLQPSCRIGLKESAAR